MSRESRQMICNELLFLLLFIDLQTRLSCSIFPIISSANPYRVYHWEYIWILLSNCWNFVLYFVQHQVQHAVDRTLTSWGVSINWKVFYPVSQKFGFFENICLAMGSSIKDISFWRKWGAVKCQKTILKNLQLSILETPLKVRICTLFFCHNHSHSHSHSALCNVYPVAMDRTRR